MPIARLIVWGVLSAVGVALPLLFGVRVHHTVRTTATAQPVHQWQVAAPFDGHVATRLAQPGDTVHAGAPLAMLDTTALHLQWKQQRARVRQASAEWNAAQAAAVERQHEATAAQLTAQASRLSARALLIEQRVQHRHSGPLPPLGQHVGFDRAYADSLTAEVEAVTATAYRVAQRRSEDEANAARASYHAATHELDLLRLRLHQAVLRAPQGGVLYADQTPLYVGSPLRSGAVTLRGYDPTAWTLRTEVSVATVAKLTPGQPAHAWLAARQPGASRTTIRASVTRIAPLPNGTSYYIHLTPYGHTGAFDTLFRPGMPADVHIHTTTTTLFAYLLDTVLPNG